MTLALTFGFYLLIHKTIQHKVKKKYRSAYIFGREQRHSPPIQYYPAHITHFVTPIFPDPSSQSFEPFFSMLQSLHQGQLLIMQSL